jgi:hypothetical protein
VPRPELKSFLGRCAPVDLFSVCISTLEFTFDITSRLLLPNFDMFSIGLRCLLSSLLLLPSVLWGQRSEARAEGNQTASSRFIASGGVGLGLDDRANKTRMKLDWERTGQRSLLSWGAPGSSSISRRRHHKAHVERTVDKISGSNPFMLIFTSGSGSSWLWQRLAVTRGVCMLGYEPLGENTRHSRPLQSSP